MQFITLNFLCPKTAYRTRKFWRERILANELLADNILVNAPHTLYNLNFLKSIFIVGPEKFGKLDKICQIRQNFLLQKVDDIDKNRKVIKPQCKSA